MSTGDYCNYMMVIAFVEVYFCYIYRLRLVLSDLHNSDGCKTWISVQLCCRCLVAFLLSGPFWPLVWTDANKKKEKRNPCALWRSPLPILMRLLTEITICKRALLLFTHAEKKKKSLPHDRLVLVPGGFYFYFITFDWCCSIFKNHSLLGDRGLSTFPTKVQKRQLNMVITCKVVVWL